MDYRKYQFCAKERILIVFESIAVTAVIAFLCYRSVYVMAGCIPVYLFLAKRKKQEYIRRRREKLGVEFKESLQAVAGALLAGYSMENAFREAEKEMTQLYGTESCMVRELKEINVKTACNQPLEPLLLDFSKRSGMEDVESFCQVLVFAKRGGGDFVQIIKATVRKIADKIEVKREIETVMAAKRLEQKVMQAVPVFILFYLDVTSPGFLSVLYGSAVGFLFMTGCLALYLAAMRIAEKFVFISV